MNQETKVLIGIGLATLMVFFGGIFFLTKKDSDQKATNNKAVDSSILVKDNSTKVGSSSAQVTVVEFGDFQCPACAVVEPIINRLLDERKDTMVLVFRHFPLPQHKNARIAAEAAEAAGAQQKFHEMYNTLYENQAEWAESNNPLEFFTKYATTLELDTQKFKDSVEKKQFAKKIEGDEADALQAGVNSTPTFFINGKKYEGALSYTEFKAAIDKELGSTTQTTTPTATDSSPTLAL